MAATCPNCCAEYTFRARPALWLRLARNEGRCVRCGDRVPLVAAVFSYNRKMRQLGFFGRDRAPFDFEPLRLSPAGAK